VFGTWHISLLSCFGICGIALAVTPYCAAARLLASRI
jgi:hypothetical protein